MSKTRPATTPEQNLTAKFLLDLYMMSTLIHGITCDFSHSQPHETKILVGKSSVKPEPIYQTSLRSYNDTIYNGNVLVTIGFDKMLHWIFNKEVEKDDRHCAARSLKFKLGERFVGHRKRLQFALLPIMYKMGVMTTLLTGLTVLVLKGLTIGVILLIFAFGNYFTKLHKHHQYEHSPQPIHVHVHSQDGHKVSSFPSYGSAPWDRTVEERHPSSYFEDTDLESYRSRFIQDSANMIKLKALGNCLPDDKIEGVEKVIAKSKGRVIAKAPERSVKIRNYNKTNKKKH